jgi:hypothetical protein
MGVGPDLSVERRNVVNSVELETELAGRLLRVMLS